MDGFNTPATVTRFLIQEGKKKNKKEASAKITHIKSYEEKKKKEPLFLAFEFSQNQANHYLFTSHMNTYIHLRIHVNTSIRMYVYIRLHIYITFQLKFPKPKTQFSDRLPNSHLKENWRHQFNHLHAFGFSSLISYACL